MTVPTTTVSVVPPSDIDLALDRASNLAELGRSDLDQVTKDLPEDTPLWVYVDLVRAGRHLRAASVLVDKIADTLAAQPKEVAR